MPLGPMAASLLMMSGCLLDSGPITELVTTGVYEVEFGGVAAGAAKAETCAFAADRHPREVVLVPVEYRTASFVFRYDWGELDCALASTEFVCPPATVSRTDLSTGDLGLDAVVVQTLTKRGRLMRVDRQTGQYTFEYACYGDDCSAAKLRDTEFRGLGREPCVVRASFDSELVSPGVDWSDLDDTGTACTGQDGDGDGVGCDEDCDDRNWQIYPGAPETCGDGIDQDCDGADEPCDTGEGCDGEDYDGDGVDCFDDCDDQNWQIYPGAPEICDDDIDQDCDGADEACDTAIPCAGENDDGDAFDCFEDCDDSDASIYPGAADIRCDGIDQNCDGVDNCDTGSVDTGPFGRRAARSADDVTAAALRRLRAVLRGG